jgi:hypothetical protein
MCFCPCVLEASEVEEGIKALRRSRSTGRTERRTFPFEVSNYAIISSNKSLVRSVGVYVGHSFTRLLPT